MSPEHSRFPNAARDEPDDGPAPTEIEPALFPGVEDRGGPARKAWQTRRAAAGPAVVEAPPEPAAQAIDPAIVDVLYTALNSVAVAMLGRAGFSQRAMQAATLTADDLANLRGPTVAMLEKYLPMGAYGVEWTFAVALLGVVAVKAMAVQSIAADEQKPAA